MKMPIFQQFYQANDMWAASETEMSTFVAYLIGKLFITEFYDNDIIALISRIVLFFLKLNVITLPLK